ncbi:hypothetical protein MPL3356_300004 [Mesorhizobium plurifarium]|uniref:Uncharacterized protein n=1 Tax=Mesorhizobium plurifarium TaxID=69974 RepID=A0A090DS24_MESPL|nr:hypothetical protein MPL3356_300004 [Mesorhizobium plurifarium]
MTMRARDEVDFAAPQSRWDAVDREVGYSAALHAEREAADRADDMLEMLSKTPAASLGGVAANLDAVLREGEVSEDSIDDPRTDFGGMMPPASAVLYMMTAACSHGRKRLLPLCPFFGGTGNKGIRKGASRASS